jgi:molybdopterin synthase catalytic subunit
MITVSITGASFEPEALLADFRIQNESAGAVASFTGSVRSENGAVSLLTISHYPSMTESEIQKIAESAMRRWPLLGLHITHRTGEMSAGEPIVFVAAASSHRREAFEAVDFMMDYLKSEAPFWKQETRAMTTEWIEPKNKDQHDIGRWRN